MLYIYFLYIYKDDIFVLNGLYNILFLVEIFLVLFGVNIILITLCPLSLVIVFSPMDKSHIQYVFCMHKEQIYKLIFGCTIICL